MKNKLSKEIAEGIYEGYNKIFLGILRGILIALFIIFIYEVISYFFIHPQPQISTRPDECSLPWVNCNILLKNKDLFSIVDKEVFCGYQEANAWYSNWKISYQNPNINKSELIMDCGP